MIGQTISHYRIEEKLGEGGMGVVYKAEDIRLRREVAVKLLSHLDDEESRERFLREAQAAAALDHPNICTVYDVDEVGGQALLAMQFVSGRSLKEKIAERPLKLEEAVDIAIQTAEGLESAHEAGVVHRDIKSANLMVTERGQVKITDFGLARLSDRTRITKTTAIMGTPAYMSPEQAEGMPVDRRSDIWSLGVVLYEMVTGRLPFEGERDQAVLLAILHEEPEPVTARRAGLPMELDRILSKALSKDPASRYQNIADLLVDLRSLAGPVASGNSLTPPQSARLTGHAPRSGWHKWVPWGVAAASLAVAAMAWLYSPSDLPEAPVYRFTIPPPEGAVIRTFELSPDGRHLAFVASESGSERLWLRSFDAQSSRPLRGTEGADPLGTPFWSPDSRYIGFFDLREGKLKKIGITGEPPVAVADAPRGRGGTWNSDGTIVFAPINDGSDAYLSAVSEDGGEPRRVTDGSVESHRSPHFLPDGERFLFFSRLEGEVGVAELRLGSLGGDGSRALMRVASHAAFLSSRSTEHGYLLTVNDAVLMAHPFDERAGRIAGDAIPAVEGVGTHVFMNRGLFSISRSGVLAYTTENAPFATFELVWFDRRGRQLEVLSSGRPYRELRFSPDRSTVAACTFDPGEGYKLHLINLRDGSGVQPDPAAQSCALSWLPGGAALIGSRASGAANMKLVRMPADGSSEPVVIMERERMFANDCSPDGEWLLLQEGGVAYGQNLLVMAVDGKETKPYLTAGYNERSGRFSPDGRFVAYSSDETGVEEIYVRSFPGAIAKQKVSHSGGVSPVWRPDGRELFYVSSENFLMSVTVINGGDGGLEFGSPRRLFPIGPNSAPGAWRSRYDVAADGQRFLVIRQREESASSPVRVIVNWQQHFQAMARER